MMESIVPPECRRILTLGMKDVAGWTEPQIDEWLHDYEADFADSSFERSLMQSVLGSTPWLQLYYALREAHRRSFGSDLPVARASALFECCEAVPWYSVKTREELRPYRDALVQIVFGRSEGSPDASG